MALSFRIDGEPVTWKRPVWLRRGVVYSPNTPFMQDIQVQLRGQFTGPILQGPLRVEVAFYFKRPNNHFAGFIRRADAATWYGRRVDLDNLNKLVFDSMSGLIYEDDKQIVHLTTSKRYSDRTHGYTDITIWPLPVN